jgi:6-pyruvoyl-tetrahydropterin synthase
MPKRFAKVVWDNSKDANTQFYNLKIDSLEEPDEFDTSYVKNSVEQKNSFLKDYMDDFDYNLLLDYLDNKNTEYFEENYNFNDEQIKFNKYRVYTIAENILNFIMDNSENMYNDKIIPL